MPSKQANLQWFQKQSMHGICPSCTDAKAVPAAELVI